MGCKWGGELGAGGWGTGRMGMVRTGTRAVTELTRRRAARDRRIWEEVKAGRSGLVGGLGEELGDVAMDGYKWRKMQQVGKGGELARS